VVWLQGIASLSDLLKANTPPVRYANIIYIYWAHLTGRGVCAPRKSLQASGVAEADLLELDEDSLAELVGMAPLACRVAVKHEIQAIKEVPRAPM
jgi:hypothetical protein